MKKTLLFFPFFIFFAVISSHSLFSDRILYAEQYYQLFHRHFYQYPEDSLENIYYLELALNANFANPLYALAKIKDKTEYQRYTHLFRMHVNLKIIEQYLILGSKYDKFEVYFFNKEGPWKNAICESVKTAEWAYTTAKYYWEQAKMWSTQAFGLRRIHLDAIQSWEDENFRIETRDLDYERIINKQLARIAEARQYLECAPNSPN
ncbi:MAG: hypothetical protein JW904_03275 [Spirochaetales bacterium]|nr:hypothetical protein [Spirochaetales bacterium]